MEQTFQGLAAVVIVGVVQVLKNTFLDSRYAPIVSLVLGLLFAVGAANLEGGPLQNEPSWEVLVAGLLVGLSAPGIQATYNTLVHGPTVVRRDDVVSGKFDVVQVFYDGE